MFSKNIIFKNFPQKKNINVIRATIKRNIYGTIKDIDEKYVKIIKSYIFDSMDFLDKIKIDKVSENSAIFLDLNRYINK